MNLATLTTFSFAAIAVWAQDALAPGCDVISDQLACFRAVAEVGCFHQAVDVRASHHVKLPEFRWINTLLRNLKTSFSGDVTPIFAPVLMRASGVIKPLSIAFGSPGAYAPGEPNAVCGRCTRFGAALPAALLLAARQIARC